MTESLFAGRGFGYSSSGEEARTRLAILVTARRPFPARIGGS
jgi:hypothetical protein